ncbi:hypothetical protein ACWD4T_02610 [Streptomyces umbrinus]
MEQSKSEIAAQARPLPGELGVAGIVDQSSAVRIEDVEDEGP